MAKLKDGFYKLTASSIGSDLLVLLAGGGAKPISDFAQFNNAYWANIPISNTSSTTTNPTFGSITVPLTGLIVGSKSTDTSPTRVLVCYDTTLVTKYINIGNDPSAGNAGEFHYTYSASASTSNNVGLGFYSGNRLKLYYNGGSGVGKAVIASAASGGTEYELLHLGNYKNYVDDLYWANLSVQQTASSTTHPTFGNVSIKGGIDTGLNLYTSDAYTRIRFYNASSANNATIHYFGTAYSGYDFVKDSLNLGCLGLVTLGGWNNPTLVVSSNTTTSNSDGKVGIGTTSPKYKLDVSGVIRANGNILLEAANSTTGGGIAFWDASGWINGTINAKNLILNYAGGNVGVGILSPKAKLHVNGDTLINKRLIIGLDLGVWDSSRAELELISPSGQAIDFWMGSGQRDWSISSRTSEESNALKFFSCTSDTITTTTTLTLEKSGNMYLYGNLHIGKSDTRNYIAFRGTTGDDLVLHQNTFIGENHFGGTESSELILFKGNDFGTNATSLSTSGPDRIRYIAAAHLFQIYKSALSGTFADICTSTVPVNMLAIHLDSIQTYAPLVIVGEKYSGNYGINMQNSDIVGINALYTADSAEDGGEGLQFSRGNGYYDSIWASSGTLYFSPNGNLNRAGSYSTNYTVIHSGNIGSQSVNYATSAGNADTVDNYHASDFVRAYSTYGTSYSYDSDWGLSIVTFDPVVSGTYPENNPNITILNLGNNYARRKQLACMYNNNNIYYRRRTDSSWSGWVRLAIAGESYTKSEADSRFVNVTGDTMTGNLTVPSLNSYYLFRTTDIAEGATNLGTLATAHTITFFRNGIMIPYKMDNANDGGMIRTKGASEDSCVFEMATWDDSGAGETIQLNYYSTTSQLTPTYSNIVPKVSGTLLNSGNWPSYIGAYGYVMREYIIDASGLNSDTWYPVTMAIGAHINVRIEVRVSLNSGLRPSWSTHTSGFSVRKIWEVNGSGWGTNTVHRTVFVSDYAHASTDPVRGMGDMGLSSTEYVYVRGGGKYFFYTSHNITPYLRTSTYVGTADPYYQAISPTTTAPGTIAGFLINRSMYASHFYENSDIKLKENVNLISSSDNIPLLKLFDWKSDGKHSYGLIAQELEAMGYSELVEESGDHKTVNYSAALSLIVGKLQVKIKELEKEIENLKNKN